VRRSRLERDEAPRTHQHIAGRRTEPQPPLEHVDGDRPLGRISPIMTARSKIMSGASRLAPGSTRSTVVAITRPSPATRPPARARRVNSAGPSASCRP
jgi:hypothetical protein